jgi:hypothetical protein
MAVQGTDVIYLERIGIPGRQTAAEMAAYMASIAQTLSNKTITAPVFSGTFTGTYTIGGTPTFPTSVATLTGTQTFSNKTHTDPIFIAFRETQNAIGTVTTTHTFVITTGTIKTATLTASTACVFTMPSVTQGRSFTVFLKQAASTGNGTATFTGVKWPGGTAPVITATAGKMDILSFVNDGTNWYGSILQNFTP